MAATGYLDIKPAMQMNKLFRLATLLLILFYGITANAQQTRIITGVIKDSSGLPVAGCTVKLQSGPVDSAVTASAAYGGFVFHLKAGNKVTLTISSIGFETLIRHYVLNNDTTIVILGTIILPAASNILNPVNVTSASPVTIKEDTVSYNVSAYKVRDNAPLEDVLRKLPGVDVDINGNVTAQGKQVTKVRVNGKDFFGGDVKTATRNLPADVVESVQMIDDYGDQANLTGVKTGEPDKIMNIVIRPDRNHGYTGQATVGDGSDALPQNPGVSNDDRYVGLVNAFRFNGNQQLALLGNINNTNVNTFSFGTLSTTDAVTTKKIALDALQTGKLSVGNNNAVGQASHQNGITAAHAAGFNYRDQWGQAISIYGSYSFADNTTAVISNTVQQNISVSNSGLTNQDNNETDRNINHRFNWNMEYKPDTVNYLKVTPAFSWSGTTTNSVQNVSSLKNGILNAAYNASVYSNLTAPNYGITALYNHRFNGHGRNLSINFTANTNSATQYQNPVYDYTAGALATPADQVINTYSHTQNYGITLSYLEPVGKFKYVELNYAFNRSHTNNNKQTDVFDSTNHLYTNDSALSNRYNFIFTTNRFGVNYRYVQKKFNYTFGIALEPTTLNGNTPVTKQDTHANTVNVIPLARLVLNLSGNRSFSLNYNGYSSQPTFTQLQPVIDFSNALYPVQGNPKLQPMFTNNFSARYNRFDFTSGNTFFSNISFSQIQNQVVSNTITYPRKYPADPALQNTYLTQFENANGYYTATAFASYAKPWHKRQYTLMLNASATYTNNIGFLTNVDSTDYKETTVKNTAKNIVFVPGVRFRVDIADKIDAQFSTSYAVSKTNNSVNNNITEASANIRTWNIGINGKNYIHKDWTLSYEYTKAFNYGYTVAVPNPNILNVYLERRFLKNNRATIRMAGFDLFNQNTGYSFATTGNYITQTVSNRLGRYYLLTLTLRLQKFAGK